MGDDTWTICVVFTFFALGNSAVLRMSRNQFSPENGFTSQFVPQIIHMASPNNYPGYYRALSAIMFVVEVWIFFKIQTVRKRDIFLSGQRTFNAFEDTGCLNTLCQTSNHLLGIKYTLLSHKNSICTFMRCGNLTYDTWIWLKITSLSSTASVLNDGRISLEIPSFCSEIFFFKTSK